jgi:hypothetical protein
MIAASTDFSALTGHPEFCIFDTQMCEVLSGQARNDKKSAFSRSFSPKFRFPARLCQNIDQAAFWAFFCFGILSSHPPIIPIASVINIIRALDMLTCHAKNLTSTTCVF